MKTIKIEAAMEDRVHKLLDHILSGIAHDYTMADVGAALSMLVGTALSASNEETITAWLEVFCRSTRAQALRVSIERALAEARQGSVQ